MHENLRLLSSLIAVSTQSIIRIELLFSRRLVTMAEILNQTGWRIRKFTDSEDPQYIAIIEKAAE
jgi:hypothetical protein